MVVTEKQLTKVVLKHDGNMSKAAKAMGVTKQAIANRLRKNPKIKQKLLNAREQALKQAGITRVKVYKTVAQGLKAERTVSVFNDDHDGKGSPYVQVTEIDYRERRESAKLCLQLFRDLETEQNDSGNNIIQLILQVMAKPPQVIDVV